MGKSLDKITYQSFYGEDGRALYDSDLITVCVTKNNSVQ